MFAGLVSGSCGSGLPKTGVATDSESGRSFRDSEALLACRLSLLNVLWRPDPHDSNPLLRVFGCLLASREVGLADLLPGKAPLRVVVALNFASLWG